MLEIDAYAILKELLQVSSPFIRERFLEHCVHAMARLLGADFAFVSRVVDAPASQVRVLAAWENGTHKEGWDFTLAGTPCDLVYDTAKFAETGAVRVANRTVVIPEALCPGMGRMDDDLVRAERLGRPLPPSPSRWKHRPST